MAKRNTPANALPLDLCTPVDAALHYADYAANRKPANGEFWIKRHPHRTVGDQVIDLQEYETRPHKCMQILAAEVRRLRELTR